VVTGRIEGQRLKVGEEIEIVGFRATQKKVGTGVEMFKKLVDEGLAGTTWVAAARTEKEMWSAGRWCASRGASRRTTKSSGGTV